MPILFAYVVVAAVAVVISLFVVEEKKLFSNFKDVHN